jgi:hypothetical protein
MRITGFVKKHLFLFITSALSFLLVVSLLLELQRFFPSPLVFILKLLLSPYFLTIMAFKGSAYDVSPGYNASETMVFVLALFITIYAYTLVGRSVDAWRPRMGGG